MSSTIQQGIHVVSVDEKTGIQALQRQHPSRNMTPGKPEAREGVIKSVWV
ncbi:MAG: hypothetical protein SVR94_02590 [Pseudomonadota bacterium]|nr:hypothetical protein [Pseudomonadota bacterium]